MKVKVIRGEGTNEYPGVIANELCSTEAVGVELAKEFLFSNGFDKYLYEITTDFKGDMVCNDVLVVSDSSIGEIFYGRVTGWSVNLSFSKDSGLNVEQTISLERSIHE